jgi:hypothetical protein
MSWLTSQLMGLTVDEAIYRSSWGQPSVVMLPYSNALGSSAVSSVLLLCTLVLVPVFGRVLSTCLTLGWQPK